MLEEGLLRIVSSNDIIMLLSHEAPVATKVSEVVSAVSEEAFIGTWNLSKALINGQLIPADMLNNMGGEVGGSLTIEVVKSRLL